LTQTVADDLDVTIASTIPKIRKEREETALTALSLTVLPNFLRFGRVERRFQIEYLELQVKARQRRRETESKRTARLRLYKGVTFVEVSYVVLADNY
jgi:hypothetical protein